MGKSGSPDKGDTRRQSVTFSSFLHFELHELIGVYGPSFSEVVSFVLQSWLHDNEERIDRRKRRFGEFRASHREPPAPSENPPGKPPGGPGGRRRKGGS